MKPFETTNFTIEVNGKIYRKNNLFRISQYRKYGSKRISRPSKKVIFKPNVKRLIIDYSHGSKNFETGHVVAFPIGKRRRDLRFNEIENLRLTDQTISFTYLGIYFNPVKGKEIKYKQKVKISFKKEREYEKVKELIFEFTKPKSKDSPIRVPKKFVRVKESDKF